MKKKIIAMLTICTLMVGSNTAVVSAHGHSQAKAAKKVTVCSVKTCKKTSTHKHNGKSYAAHKSNDGHSYHKSTASHKKSHH